MVRGLSSALTVAAGLLGLVSASPEVDVRTYNAPGHTDADTHMAIRRGLAEARHQKREELKGNVTFDRSWDGAVLLKYGTSQSIDTGNTSASASVSETVEIVCSTCYVKGIASAELQIADDFDAGDAINKTVASVFDTVENFTNGVEDYFETYFKGIVKNLDDGIDWRDFAFPSLNASFEMELKPIDDVTLNFQFDQMELYLELNTILSAGATYELNLFTSNTPIGIGAGKDLTLGVVFKVDLLLSVEGSVDISSGVHIKLDDGVGINIALFGDAVSKLVFNGGQFEFLPVTVEKAGVVISAMLRIGIHSGISVVAPGVPDVTIFNTTFGSPKVAGGIEVGVYANLAEFKTNVTVAPEGEDCAFKVQQDYQIAMGAAAGASIVFDTDTWGPVAATSVVIWNTALPEVCASKATKTPSSVSASATITPAPSKTGKAKRADDDDDLDGKSETVTTKTKITHTGVQCQTSVIGNCPNSLQQTTQTVETRTLTTVVPSGQKVTWPATPGVTDKVTETRGFGDNAVSFTATSGPPVSYTPPPPEPSPSGTSDGAKDGEEEQPSKTDEIVNGKTGGVSNKVIIGVSVGVGVPVLIGIIAAIIFFARKRAYKSVPAPSFAPDNIDYKRASMSTTDTRHDGFEPYRWEDVRPVVHGAGIAR